MNRICAICLVLVFAFWGCSAKLTKIETAKKISEKIPAKSAFVKVDNLEIHYLEAGSGDPMILIHGWLCSGASWEKVIPVLAEKFHVYAIDLPGHGLSDKPLTDDIRYSTDNQAKWVIGFMDRLSIEKAYIVGHSMGGEIGAKIALAAPQRVKKLVMVDATGLEKNPKIIPFYLRMARGLHLYSPAFRMAFRTGVKIFLRLSMYYSKNPVDEDFVEQLMLTTFASQKDRKCAIKVTNEGLFKSFIDDRAPAITTPTLLVWGKYDKVVPLSLGKRYHDLIPGSKLVVIDKSGHIVPFEKPQELCKAIFLFCDNAQGQA